MKKIILIAAVAALASCQNNSNPLKGKVKARLHPAWFSTYEAKYLPKEEVVIRYVDSMTKAGDLIVLLNSTTGEDHYIVDSVATR